MIVTKIDLRGEALREFMLSKVDPTATYNVFSTLSSDREEREDCMVLGETLRGIISDADLDELSAAEYGREVYGFHVDVFVYAEVTT